MSGDVHARCFGLAVISICWRMTNDEPIKFVSSIYHCPDDFIGGPQNIEEQLDVVYTLFNPIRDKLFRCGDIGNEPVCWVAGYQAHDGSVDATKASRAANISYSGGSARLESGVGETTHVESRGDAVLTHWREVGTLLDVAVSVDKPWKQVASISIHDGGTMRICVGYDTAREHNRRCRRGKAVAIPDVDVFDGYVFTECCPLFKCREACQCRASKAKEDTSDECGNVRHREIARFLWISLFFLMRSETWKCFSRFRGLKFIAFSPVPNDFGEPRPVCSLHALHRTGSSILLSG